MKKLFITLTAILISVISFAQTSQYPPLDESVFEGNEQYQQGNKYQKDAMLFVRMLTDTHPYYIKKERRDSLMAKYDLLMKACAECTSDKEFTGILFDVLGKLHDKHTDLLDLQSYQEMRQGKISSNEQSMQQTQTGVMAYGNDLFHYTIFPEYSICYLQFNQCADARTTGSESFPRWDTTIEKMFSEMKEDGIQTLVVDAQYNGGGNSMLCDELLVHLYPASQMKSFTTWLRFSDLMGTFNPRIAVAKKAWEEDGHIDELYPMGGGSVSAEFVQPELFEGNVVFVQSQKTYSSAGMLMTLARDNKIGTIIGESSSYSPSHYGEILPYSLPNTGVLGSVCTKMFARPDTEHVDDDCLVPDVVMDLGDKDAVWDYIVSKYGIKDVNHPDVYNEEYVELMEIIARFADNSVFADDYAPRYQKEVDEYFAAYKDHPAVKWLAAHETSKPWISYDAIPWLGAHAYLKDGQFELIPKCEKDYNRWPKWATKEFLPLLTDFYNETSFHQFYLEHEKMYSTAVETFRRNVANYIDLDWYDDFFGSQKNRPMVTYSDKVNFGVIVPLNNGAGNFGIKRQKPGQNLEVLSAMLYAERKNGTPHYDVNDQEVFLLVHEFCHSYLTSSKAFKKIGTSLLENNRKKLNSVGYGIWENVIEETFVRIAVIRYMVDHRYSEDIIKEQIAAEHEFYGFTWIPEDIEWYKGDILGIFDQMKL